MSDTSDGTMCSIAGMSGRSSRSFSQPPSTFRPRSAVSSRRSRPMPGSLRVNAARMPSVALSVGTRP
ncbi:hypothetical protein ACFMQL_01655 [Nonomuraea fastidiosa]|uniref:hypothetical protein n=1 Tax=Nonomuraea fastidiosa TaxID=46173 RepID=UPI003673471C